MINGGWLLWNDEESVTVDQVTRTRTRVSARFTDEDSTSTRINGLSACEKFQIGGLCCHKRKKKHELFKKYLTTKIPYRVIIKIFGFIELGIIDSRDSTISLRSMVSGFENHFYNLKNNIINELFGRFIPDRQRKCFLLYSAVNIRDLWGKKNIGNEIRPSNLKSLTIYNFSFNETGFKRFNRYPYLETLTIRNMENQYTFPRLLNSIIVSYPKLKNLDIDSMIDTELLSKTSLGEKYLLHPIEFPKKLKKLRICVHSDFLLTKPRKKLFNFPSELKKLNIDFRMRSPSDDDDDDNVLETIKNTRVLLQQLLHHTCFKKKKSSSLYSFQQQQQQQPKTTFHDSLRHLSLSFSGINVYLNQELNTVDFRPPIEFRMIRSPSFKFLHNFKNIKRLDVISPFNEMRYLKSLKSRELILEYDAPGGHINIRVFKTIHEFVTMTADDLITLYEIRTLDNIKISGISYDMNTYDINPKHLSFRIPKERENLRLRFENIFLVSPSQEDEEEGLKKMKKRKECSLKTLFHLPESFLELKVNNLIILDDAKEKIVSLEPFDFPSTEVLNLSRFRFLRYNILSSIPKTVKYLFLNGCVIGCGNDEDETKKGVRLRNSVMKERIRSFKILSFDHCVFSGDFWNENFGSKKKMNFFLNKKKRISCDEIDETQNFFFHPPPRNFTRSRILLLNNILNELNEEEEEKKEKKYDLRFKKVVRDQRYRFVVMNELNSVNNKRKNKNKKKRVEVQTEVEFIFKHSMVLKDQKELEEDEENELGVVLVPTLEQLSEEDGDADMFGIVRYGNIRVFRRRERTENTIIRLKRRKHGMKRKEKKRKRITKKYQKKMSKRNRKFSKFNRKRQKGFFHGKGGKRTRNYKGF